MLPSEYLKMKNIITLIFALLIMILTFSCSTVQKKIEINKEPVKDIIKPKIVIPDSAYKNLLENKNKIILTIADSLESLNLYYNRNPNSLQDCSGIFHRVLQSLQARCSTLNLPDIQTARSSRTIANWYHEQKQFVIIEDAIKQSNLIQPGSVLFFGRRWTKYKNLTLEKVMTQIHHLAVVVDVTNNSKGELQSYRIFHGRSKGKCASITDWHRRCPPKKKLPPFGNWDEQWIGYAPLLIPKNSQKQNLSDDS